MTDELKFNIREIKDVLERSLVLRGRDCQLEPESAEIRIFFRAEQCGPELLMEGRIQSNFKGECARCLAPADVRIDETFQTTVKNEPEMEVNVLPHVRDCFLAGIPIQSLCREDCTGLCPVCGEDRNVRECGCGAAEKGGALKALLEEAMERGTAEKQF